MDIINKLRENSDLSEMMYEVCDVDILPEFRKPQDEDGHLSYNISGQTFAKEDSGSEYILLEDGSVAFWGSEGQGGRLADNLQDFFELVIYCPFWKECVYEGFYEDIEELGEFAKEAFEEYQEDVEESESDLLKEQEELGDRLGITKSTDLPGILMKFYHSAKREPVFIMTYTEDDGSVHSDMGSLFKE